MLEDIEYCDIHRDERRDLRPADHVSFAQPVSPGTTLPMEDTAYPAELRAMLARFDASELRDARGTAFSKYYYAAAPGTRRILGPAGASPTGPATVLTASWPSARTEGGRSLKCRCSSSERRRARRARMLYWSGPRLGPKRGNNTVGATCCMVLFRNGI